MVIGTPGKKARSRVFQRFASSGEHVADRAKQLASEMRTPKLTQRTCTIIFPCMTIHVTATQLRKDVYHLLDQVVNSGEIIEVKRKGKLVRIVPVGSVSKLASLKPHSSAITGNPDDLVHTDWSENWKPEL